MESGNKAENGVENSMKNLKIDASPKVRETSEAVTREGSGADAVSCISSADATANSVKGSEVDQEGFMGDQGMYYYGYCYPGYTGSYGEWDEQSYYMTPDNGENQLSAFQADNGSPLYYLPGYQAGYPSYNPVIPGPVLGVDGQYLAQQAYYPAPMLQQPLGSPGFVHQPVAYGSELVPAYPWDSALFFPNGFQANGFYGDQTTAAPKPSFSSRNQTYSSSKTSTSSKSTSETKETSLGLDVKPTHAVPKQSLKALNKGASPVFSKGFIPVNKIPSYTNQGNGGVLYPNSPMNIKDSGRTWVGPEKVKARNKLHGFGEFDLLSEQNRGPRTNSNKILAAFPDAGKNNPDGAPLTTVRKDMYNLPEFSTDFDHAFFFVIKSYSEDDIHKSIKYNVWASTPSGNRRLDNAFQLAQERTAEKGGKCPVFLFFSVNASGQFCGVAEMLDRVDFEKSMDFWQQDKWNGFFPVKWHVIKDVPNPQFRHILLENNENKPVTNSRDTQEVKYPQGREMLKTFKNFSSKTSILDDFDFYETRQKVMQQKRNKLPSLHFVRPPPKTEEVSLDLKPDDLKSVSILHSTELEAAKVEEPQLTEVADKE